MSYGAAEKVEIPNGVSNAYTLIVKNIIILIN